MAERLSSQDLMRYLDGELAPDERARVQAEIEGSTELQREVAIFSSLKADFRELSFHPGAHYQSVWDRVNAHVTRPVGWILIVVGTVIWMTYGAYVFTVSPADPWEKLTTGAIVIGVLMLFASVIWERYREWDKDPYRHVHR